MKYEKFEGSLGEFLEQYAKGASKFYTDKSAQIVANNVDDLLEVYNQGVYTQKEERWTDHLPVLCLVRDSHNMEEEFVALIVSYDGLGYVTDLDDRFIYARPVTQEEIDGFIWNGEK